MTRRLRLLSLALVPFLHACVTDSGSGASGAGQVWFGSVQDDDPDLWAWRRVDSVYTRSGTFFGLDSSFGMTALFGSGPDTAWLTCRGTAAPGATFLVDGEGLRHGTCGAQLHDGKARWVSREGSVALRGAEVSGGTLQLTGTWNAVMEGVSGASGERSLTVSFRGVQARTDRSAARVAP